MLTTEAKKHYKKHFEPLTKPQERLTNTKIIFNSFNYTTCMMTGLFVVVNILYK